MGQAGNAVALGSEELSDGLPGTRVVLIENLRGDHVELSRREVGALVVHCDRLSGVKCPYLHRFTDGG